MAFVSRAERSIKTNSISNVGPGSYTNLTFYQQQQTFAPFSSTSERKLFKTSEKTPGPGSYNTSIGIKTSGSQKRFKSLPKKSITKETIQESPGPGSYFVQDLWKIKKSNNKNNNLRGWNRIPSAPSIPANHQAYGYDETANGDLIMQGSPEKVLSGNPTDSVGPGHYSIQEELKPKGFSWFKSKSKRVLNFRDVTGPEIGPGSYQELSNSVGPLYKYKQSAVFLSRSKEPCTTISEIGPGSYDPVKNTPVKISSKKLQNFGSNSIRFCSKVPESDIGPGYYCPNSPKNSVVSKAPFASSNIRFKYQASPTPGPGTYEEPVGAIQGVKHNKPKQVFFTSEKRFANKIKSKTPGPGQYSQQQRLSAADFKPNAVFMRKSVRGQSVPTQNPAPGSYEVQSELGKSKKKGRNMHPGFKTKEEKDVGFYSKVSRFSEKTLEEHPGPGSYENLLGPCKKAAIVGKDSRFKPGKHFVPGPGAYLEDNDDWNKRSYNVLFTDIF